MSLLKVMSYNVGHYNMGLSATGFPASVMNEKLASLKELLIAEHPDFIGLQEDAKWIDAAHTVTSSASLFDPYWRFRPEGNGSTVRARQNCISGSNGKELFKSGRHFRKAAFQMEGKTVLFISCHPTAHVGNSAVRKQEYEQLFSYVNDMQWDICIITGDFNTTEQDDKNNLRTACDENGFDMAIGTYLPWVSTYLGKDGTARQSFDNILVGGKVKILSVRILRDWYSRLYSDHVPVCAEIAIE